MANSVDPDQMHQIRVFTVCKGLSVPIFRVITVGLVELQLWLDSSWMFIDGEFKSVSWKYSVL